MIDISEHDILSENISTLKELSKDDHDSSNIVYMTESNLEAVSFDDVKTQYTSDLGLRNRVAASLDALALVDSCTIFVEFKNGSMKGKVKEVKDKIRDSLLIFCDIVKTDISYTRQNIIFILVYNEQKNPISREEIATHVLNKAGKELIRYDLEQFETIFFKEVHTYTESQFNKYINKIKS